MASVLLDVLVLAGTDMATTPWEQCVVYWLVEHDQARVGLGMSGFDIADFGWSRERATFEAERRFVLALIDAAMNRHGWNRLPFAPPEKSLLDLLKRARQLIVDFTIEAVHSGVEGCWSAREPPTHGLCEVHRVYLHELGCIICNDAPLDAAANTVPNRTK